MSATLRGLGLCIDDLGSTFGTSSAPPISPGTVVEDDTGGSFMFVYNTGATSITQYYGAFHTSTTVPGYIASAGLSAKLYAGAAMTAIDSSNYGWICVRGYCTAYVSAAIGTVGWACCGGTLGVNTATATGDPIIGVAVVTTNAAGTGAVIKFNIA
jgi:hypothetical protein